MDPDWYVRLAGPVAVGLDPFFSASWPIGPKFFTDLGARQPAVGSPVGRSNQSRVGPVRRTGPPRIGRPVWRCGVLAAAIYIVSSLSPLRVSPTSSHTIAEQSASESRYLGMTVCSNQSSRALRLAGNNQTQQKNKRACPPMRQTRPCIDTLTASSPLLSSLIHRL